MAPKKSRVEIVDGVHCSHNFASGNVIVGTGLVGHDQRDCFKLKADSTLEEQVRSRPKFTALAAAAASVAAGESVRAEAPRQEAPLPGAAMLHEPAPPASVLFGTTRQLPSQPPAGVSLALAPHLLESDLVMAWEIKTKAQMQAAVPGFAVSSVLPQLHVILGSGTQDRGTVIFIVAVWGPILTAYR